MESETKAILRQMEDLMRKQTDALVEILPGTWVEENGAAKQFVKDHLLLHANLKSAIENMDYKPPFSST